MIRVAIEASHRHKLDSQWNRVTWVGKTEESDEHIGLISIGAITGRTCRRLPLSERFDAELLKSIFCKPWDGKVSMTAAASGWSMESISRSSLPPEFIADSTRNFVQTSSDEPDVSTSPAADDAAAASSSSNNLFQQKRSNSVDATELGSSSKAAKVNVD